MRPSSEPCGKLRYDGYMNGVTSPVTEAGQSCQHFGHVLRPLQGEDEASAKHLSYVAHPGALEKSALAGHAWKNHHPIKWQEVSMVDWARTSKELLVKEAINIGLNHPSLDEMQGYIQQVLRTRLSCSASSSC